MFTLNLISAIIWIIAKTVTGATFTAVGNVVQPNIFLCGKQVTLMCSESSLVLSMKFTLDGIQVASCLFPSCTTNPDFSSNFTMDSTKGIFNFTLHAVKTSDNGRDFICNINENDQQIIPKVAELPQNNSLDIQSYKVPSGTEIKAIIGCVFPNTSIRFEWYTVKVSNETDVKPYYATDNTTEPNNTLCAPLSDCKGSGLSNAFVIQEGGNSARGEVYLEVHVIHDYSPNQLIAVKRTFYSFNISDPVTTTTAQQTTPPNTTTFSTTTSRNSSASSFTSSTENIKASSSPGTSSSLTTKHVLGPEQNNQYVDDTSTILTAVFSSLAGILFLVIIVFVFRKIRELCKKRPEGTQMYGLDTN